MNNNKNQKTITLLVSLYSWDRRTPKTEDIFEVRIRNMEDMTIITHRLGFKTKFKKLTDKNWYTYRAMTKRLYKEEIQEDRENLKPLFVATNDLKLILEERRKVLEEKEHNKQKLRNSPIYEIEREINRLENYGKSLIPYIDYY